jgi:L-asparagine oxygenase
MLRCLQGSPAVPTILTDGLPIINQVGETALTRALVKPRRAVQGKRSLLRVYERDHLGVPLLRWDEKYILPASPAGERGISQFRAALAAAPCRNVYLARAGDTLVLDNWRMLHGRGSVPSDALNRTIARAYLRSIH